MSIGGSEWNVGGGGRVSGRGEVMGGVGMSHRSTLGHNPVTPTYHRQNRHSNSCSRHCVRKIVVKWDMESEPVLSRTDLLLLVATEKTSANSLTFLLQFSHWKCDTCNIIM